MRGRELVSYHRGEASVGVAEADPVPLLGETLRRIKDGLRRRSCEWAPVPGGRTNA